MTRNISSNDLRGLLPFNAMSAQAFRRLTDHSIVRRLCKQNYLYDAQTPAKNLYVLLEGVLKYGHYFSADREIVRGLYFPGSLIGIGALLDQPFQTGFSCTLNAEAQYIEIPVELLKELIEKDPKILESIIQVIAKRLYACEMEAANILLYDVRERIERFLIQQHAYLKENNTIISLFKIGLTQQDVANIVGATRQTVALVMNDLKKPDEHDRVRYQPLRHPIVTNTNTIEWEKT